MRKTQAAPTQTNPNREKNTEQPKSYYQRAKDVTVTLKTWLNQAVDYLQKRSGAVTTVATVVIAVATIFYVVYSRAQWKEMNHLNKLTEQAATAATEQSIAAKESIKIASDALDLARKERRAWVIPTIRGEYSFAPDKETKVVVLLANYGKIPAQNISTEYTIAIFQPPLCARMSETVPPPEITEEGETG